MSLLMKETWIPKGQYYKKRKLQKNISFEEEYWVGQVDPDGRERDLLNDIAQKLKDCENELSFINQLTPGRILDFGCGLGQVLSGVDDTWKKYGMDVSTFAAKHASQFGEIFCGTLQEAPYEEDFFDVIFMYHVIEHLKNPEEIVRNLGKLLKKGGKLIVGTPNFDSACARMFGDRYRFLEDPTHISLFSDYSLREMLEDFGYVIDYIDYPYFETEHFNMENFQRLKNDQETSPPFYGNIFTIYATKN